MNIFNVRERDSLLNLLQLEGFFVGGGGEGGGLCFVFLPSLNQHFSLHACSSLLLILFIAYRR